MSKGYVYVLSNPAMPGIVKIGRTVRSAEERAAQIYQTGVPLPFVVEAQIATPDCEELELWAHENFDDCRVSQSREFFAVAPEKAKKFLADNVRDQVGYIVSEYLPDDRIQHKDLTFKRWALEHRAERVGCTPEELVLALSAVCDDDVRYYLKWLKAADKSTPIERHLALVVVNG